MNKRPDIILIAALEFFDILPQELAKMIVKLYDDPVPINYDTAVDLVASAFSSLVDELELTNDQDVATEPPQHTSETPEVCTPCESVLASLRLAMDKYHEAGHK